MSVSQIQTYGKLIKFSHTVFALPFALVALLLAHRLHPVKWTALVWIVLAMAAARSAAMGFNRLVDYEYDKRNPRTSSRPLTAGAIDKRSVILFVAASSCLFILIAAMLGKLCLMLSIPVLCVLFSYSYTKRFTSLSHIFLGFSIGLAPVGAWIAATGTLDGKAILISLALMTYIAGFDILYACQDLEFDRKENLFSMPARMGLNRSLRISSLLHIGTFIFLSAIHFAFGLGRIYPIFLAFISLLLIIEHKLVHPENLERLNIAFFHVNTIISISLFLGIWIDIRYSG
ncbi:MAG: UbiA-like polyprenyltransferase [Syntrophobacteraceae bacterium]